MKLTAVSAIAALFASGVVADIQVQDSDLDGQVPIAVAPDSGDIPGESPLKLCWTDQEQALDIHSIDLEPNPPQKGANLTIHATGTLHTTITDGAYVNVEVSYGYIKLVHETFDLCEQVENVDLKCPIEKGDLDLTKTVKLPPQVPPGKYNVFAQAYTAYDELLTCLTAQIEFPVA